MVFKRASDATGERIPLAKKKSNASSSSSSSRRQTLPFYVAPAKRYYYWTPKALLAARRAASARDDGESASARRKKKHVGRLGERTSPFPSIWCCCLGEFQTDALRRHRKLPRAFVDGYTVSTHPNDLPAHVLDEWDPRRLAAVERERARGARRRDGDDGDHGDDGARGDDRGKRGGKIKKLRRFAGFRCVLYTGPHTTAFAW